MNVLGRAKKGRGYLAAELNCSQNASASVEYRYALASEFIPKTDDELEPAIKLGDAPALLCWPRY